MTQITPPPPSPMQAPAPAAAPRQKNTLGIVALVFGIVGFVFACIPGALIVGWLLLPVAFILGIIALCQRGKSKWAGLTALILSVVGSVVGAMVFFFVVASAVDSALDETVGGETVIADDAAADPAGEDEAEPAENATGTRDEPVSFDSTIENGNWTITLADFVPDATAELEADGLTTETAGPDQVWITFTPTVTYHGDESGIAAEVSFAYVAADGTVIDGLDAMALGQDDAFDSLAELYDGASATGAVALLVPNGLDGTIRVTPGLLADDVFVGLP